MNQWEERIHRHSDPAVVAEHVLRYRFARPLVEASALWVDLGCGTGAAASAALGDALPARVMLVDVSWDAAEEAARTLGGEPKLMGGDLSDPAFLEELGTAIEAARAGGPACLTCFEVVEHLPRFAECVLFLVTQGTDGDADVVLSVPNDAFWAIENPYHESVWGAGAFDELRRVLPEDHRVAEQMPVDGSVLRLDGDDGALTLTLDGPGSVPSHFVVAFGPRAGALATAAHVQAADLAGRRRWERQREADLEYFAAERERLLERQGE